MANVTKVVSTVEHRWPNGTSVSLYKRVSRDGQWTPSGAAVATATVTNGVLTFASVPDDGAGYLMVGNNAAGVPVAAATGVQSKTSWAAAH